jgi:hypothetical protein
MENSHKLSNLQLELLKIFRHDLSDQQLIEIRNLLAMYFAQTATYEMDKLWEINQWSNETMKTWADEHLRNKSFSK